MANDNSTNNGATTGTNKHTNMAQWVDEQIAGLSPAESWRPDSGLALARLRRREQSAGARRRLVKWGTGAAGVAGLALLSFPSTRAATYQACLDACAAVWPSLAATQALQRQADGKAAEFVLPDAEGRPVRLSDFHGKVVLLNFWATWCAPCKTEMPWFVEFQRNYRDRGFTVVAVSLDEQGWQAVKPFLADLEPNFPVVVGNDEVAGLFGGVEALPTTLLIDREGVIRSRHMGLVSAEEYQEGIEALLDQ